MFDPKITKGEWKIGEGPQSIFKLGIFTQDGRFLCSTSGHTDNKDGAQEIIDKENEENAKAIVAVPELLSIYHSLKEYVLRKESQDDYGFNSINNAYRNLLDKIKKLEER